MKKWRSASKPAVGDSRYGQSTFFPTTFGFLLLHILDHGASCPLLFLARMRASFCCNMSRPPGSRHAARLPLFRSDLNTSMLPAVASEPRRVERELKRVRRPRSTATAAELGCCQSIPPCLQTHGLRILKVCRRGTWKPQRRSRANVRAAPTEQNGT